MKILKLYLTRHGQTLWNVESRLQGWGDSPLTEKGISNARALGERLKNIEFYEVYASPLGRAMTTAQIVSGLEKDKIISDNNLMEIKFGSWEGMLKEDIKKEYPKENYEFWNKPHLFKKEDAETFNDVQKRALISINNIIKKHGNTDRNILVVSHAIILRTIMAYFEDRSFENLWEAPVMHDTSLSLIEIIDGKNTIKLYSDISHNTDL